MEKRYDAAKIEQLIAQQWQTEQTYKLETGHKNTYTIDTPPPTVSGSLHIGHIFSYTQTDIIARYKRMSGHAVFYPFGFDDNGLATERFVEKKRKIKGHQLPRSEFIQICLEESALAAQSFKALWQRMGISADWDKTYSTISAQSRKISQASFIELYKKGYIYRKNDPALYCPSCRTSVAQAELDDIQLSSFFNDIVFTDQNGNDLVIGTTRPELLSSCVAILYNPNDERYRHLKGQNALVPLFNYEVPILEDELVSIEKGTGLVMCCTFGDKTDIAWYKRFKLPYKPSIGSDGKWLPTTGLLAGLKVHEAREKVLEALKEKNLLLKQQAITHAVNVHERCKTEIEFIQLSQWFINILEYKNLFLTVADTINWYPTFMKSRYVNWVENLDWDWCISRQRFYGVPFPAWHCADCNTVLLARQQDLPIDPQETKFVGTCSHCNSTNILPDTDVMDTWNTSSLTPYICESIYRDTDTIDFNNSQFIPMSMRPQAHDIIRTWAFDTIVKTMLHQNKTPWHDIVISGHVLSGVGDKLSKSQGNASMTPEKLLEQYSADVIRYWTASGRLGQDMAFSESQLKIGQRLVTKIWNAFIFTKEHIFQKDFSKKPDALGTINEWILHSVSEQYHNYQDYFTKHEFGLALSQVEQFFWTDFCDNYLELIKNQLFNPEQYAPAQVYATQWTLYQIGLRILQMYAPYLPYVTEAIYQEIYKADCNFASIHHTQFAMVQNPHSFAQSFDAAQNIVKLVIGVRKLKTEHQLSLKESFELLTVHVVDEAIIEQLKNNEQIIRGVVHAKTIQYTTQVLDTAKLVQQNSLWHAQIAL